MPIRSTLFALSSTLLFSQFVSCAPAAAQPRYQRTSDSHGLRKDGLPYYWLADTAWDLLYATKGDDIGAYVTARRAQGFNTVLVQLVGGEPKAHDRAGIASVAMTPTGHLVANPAFLAEAAQKIRELNAAGMTVAIVVSWANNVRMGLFDQDSARQFGRDVGRALGAEDVIWLLGGDENPSPQTTPIWLAMGEGLRAASPRRHLMSYHPTSGSTSQWFADQPWLDFNAIQSGHARYRPQIKSISGLIRADFNAMPTRPVVDLESGYEYIPEGLYRLHPAGQPVAADERLDAYDIRARAYLQYVSGAFGYTYGHLDVVKFWNPGKPEKWPGEIPWRSALKAPGAEQLRIYQAVRKRMGSPYMVPDGRIVPPSGRIPDYARILAGCTPDRQRCLVYSPSGTTIGLTPGSLDRRLAFTWIDPRTGASRSAMPNRTDGALRFTPPVASGEAFVPKQGERSPHDWLLAIEPAG